MLTKLRIVLNEVKLIKHLAIRPTRITNWRSFRPTVTAPPVFTAIIEENPLTRVNTARITGFFRTNIGLTTAQACFFI